ncbi:type IV pillus assembly protein [Burkholderia sp. WAC0059]|uniref:PilW family protein n=1 Tax=Burkholderia sp. WAC0059 TaxID=2066022 RepID=UPI000C7E86C9|nr:PilW family protein [Burkholderia sp. WAC0059]PLZ00178.1 type IV pillus assembly protein [Burkholderia sp. WAC0059]
MTASPQEKQGCAGHTLIEFVIALALGLIVVAGAVSTYRSQRVAFAYAMDADRLRDAGMNALTLIGEQVQMAGFVPADMPAGASIEPIFGCTAGRPAGTDGSNACEPLPGRSDGLTIRYVGDAESTWLSSTGQITDCLGQAVGTEGSLIVNRYYARTSGSTGQPELYCEGSGRPGTAQPLVEGVEQLRLRYWLTGVPQPLDASAVVQDQWSDVTAVDLCVLVRGAAFARRVRYADCDGVSATSTDGRARQAFWRHVTLRNGLEGGA